MGTKSMSCLINSISRFIHLVSCQTSRSVPNLKDFESMAALMKRFKPLVDGVVDGKIPQEELLLKECEKLDSDVNEARDFMEKWSPKASRILSVWQSELVLMKIRVSLLEICHMLCALLGSSPSSSSLAGVQNCMQELQNWEPNRILAHIEKALKDQNDKSTSCTEDLVEIIESLGLTSNQELLKESIVVEKERMKAQDQRTKGEVDQIYRIADLISLIRDYMLKSGYFDSVLGFSIPSYFRCPLSLELMLDPVIVASGLTFESAAIQEWFDHGLSICPKTGQPLSHSKVLPNHTIKAMISNWFEENNHELPCKSSSNLAHRPPLSNQGPRHDVIHTGSFRDSLHSSNSTSRSSIELGDACARRKIDDISHSAEEEPSVGRTIEFVEVVHPSPRHSYTHSRAQSDSSAFTSYDYRPTTTEVARISNRREKVRSSEIKLECFSPNTKASVSGRGSYTSKSNTELSDSQNNSYPSTDVQFDETTTSSYVEKLVEDLKSQSDVVQTSAARQLRLLAKNNVENREIIGKCGAIGPLISLLHSDEKITQEHAVTALLNLSINEENKAVIAEAGAIEPFIHVLQSGNDAAKENSAAALFSVSVLEEHKVKIGRSGAVKALINLLASGTVRGKKDAVTALFNLSICHENKARIVQAGAVKYLVKLLDQDSGLVDKSIALLANLATVSEGRSAIAREGGIPLIVEILDCGSRRGRENAASTLLQLCLSSNKFCNMVLQEGAVPPLVELCQIGTPRAREKAQQLLAHFRSQREAATSNKKKP